MSNLEQQQLLEITLSEKPGSVTEPPEWYFSQQRGDTETSAVL